MNGTARAEDCRLDPRVNIQNDHGKAKEYQVRQVITAIGKLEESNGDEA